MYPKCRRGFFFADTGSLAIWPCGYMANGEAKFAGLQVRLVTAPVPKLAVILVNHFYFTSGMTQTCRWRHTTLCRTSCGDPPMEPIKT